MARFTASEMTPNLRNQGPSYDMYFTFDGVWRVYVYTYLTMGLTERQTRWHHVYLQKRKSSRDCRGCAK